MPKSITIRGPAGKPGSVYYPLQLNEIPKPVPKANELLIRVTAAALNHRDLFIRQHLYPGTAFTTPLFADGCGVVISTGRDASPSWQGKRVVLNPGTGWKDSSDGPEDAGGYKILGGTRTNPLGTLQEWLCVEEGEVEEAPGFLSDAEAAALPLTGLTAWRAVISKAGMGNVAAGTNVLITGIGGGVALMGLSFAVARGANVYVTSGGAEKIEKAVGLGAKGGVNYKEEGWEKKLMGMLPTERKWVDAVIDGAGGDVVEKGTKILKAGGVIVTYGMTVGPKMSFLMQAVLKNIDLKGSTMGSRKEFKDMVDFVKEKKIRPVVSRVVRGIEDLDAIDGLFDDMKKGSQFGKLVVEIGEESKV